MSEPVNLDALREVIREAGRVDQPPPGLPAEEKARVKPAKGPGKGIRTCGFGSLSLDEQERFQRELRAQGIEFGLAGKGPGREVVLPPSSVEGESYEAILNLLAAFGLAIG